MRSVLLPLIAALSVALSGPLRGPCCCASPAGEAVCCPAAVDAETACCATCCQATCCQGESPSETPAPSKPGPCGCDGCPAETPADPASPADPPAPPETVDSAEAGTLLPAPMPEDPDLLAASDPVGLSPLTRPPPERRALICVWTL